MAWLGSVCLAIPGAALQTPLVVQDYGLGNVYAALHDVCMEIPRDQYRYRICGFNKAAQVEGSSEVSLGKFSRCEDGCSRMFFTQVCP